VSSSFAPSSPSSPPCVAVCIDGKPFIALVDTGATRSCVSVSALPTDRRHEPYEPVAITAADASPLANRGASTLALAIGPSTLAWPFVVLERSAYHVIVGTDLLEHLQAEVHLRDRRLVFAQGASLPFTSALATAAPLPPAATLALVADTDDALLQPDAPPPTDDALAAAVATDLSATDRDRLVAFLRAHRDGFARDPKRPGTTVAITRAITTGDAAPVASRAYRVGPFELDRQREEVDHLLADGLIRPSTSPWASPIVMADKKDGTKRFCCDYRKLNGVTVPDRYPAPPRRRHYSKSIGDHLAHLAAVFDRLADANLHLKLSKCAFGRSSVPFLGHIAANDGLRPDPAKLRAIAEMPAPTDVDGERAFLGLCNDYRRFVAKFAELAEPLVAPLLVLVIQSGAPSDRSDCCQAAIRTPAGSDLFGAHSPVSALRCP